MTARRALICAPRMPEYDRQGGSKRYFDLIEMLQELGWAVTVLGKHSADARYERLLRQHGVATYVGTDSKADELIANGQFDLAIVVFWHTAETFIQKIRALSPDTRVVVDMIDLHFLRNARRIFGAGRGDGGMYTLDLDYASDLMRELNVYAAADGVLAVSKKEADLVNDFIGDPNLAHIVPLCADLGSADVPPSERKGILFVGNFQHPPNAEAVHFLCQDILPCVPSNVLAQHPVYIVGNALSESVCSYGADSPHVRMIGWVPTVLPYIQRARISVVPLLHGAGTKSKLIETLMAGTPNVSTSLGTEGLNLRDGEHVLVADDAESFAGAIVRLLEDSELWERLACQGQAQVAAMHSREAVRQRLVDATELVLMRQTKPAQLADPKTLAPEYQANQQYKRITQRIRERVHKTLPSGVTVAVVSKGDGDLLKLDGRRGWHFPQTDDGLYAGYHPADSSEAIEHLEALRAKGADYLLLPSTALWWLEHYPEFRSHLESHYREIEPREDTCAIFALHERPSEREEIDRAVKASEESPNVLSGVGD